MRGKRKEHEWDFMGFCNYQGMEISLAYCGLCNKYSYHTDKGLTFIPNGEAKKLLKQIEKTEKEHGK